MTLDGDHLKSRPVATRILSITFMFLLLIALTVLIFPALGFPQSGLANDAYIASDSRKLQRAEVWLSCLPAFPRYPSKEEWRSRGPDSFWGRPRGKERD